MKISDDMKYVVELILFCVFVSVWYSLFGFENTVITLLVVILANMPFDKS